MSIGLILRLNFCSMAGFLVLIWYFNQAWPLQYGIVRPLYFPLSPLFRLFKRDNGDSTHIKSEETTKESMKYFEEERTKNKIKVRIQGLHKSFGKKKALTNINLNLYENQLTALLGHK